MATKDTSKIIRFRGLRQMTENQADKLRNVSNVHDFDTIHETSALDEIFAPDPRTGNPSSDLYFKLGANPEIKNFIETNLQSQVKLMTKTDNVDDALILTRSRFESSLEFGDRVREFISKSSQNTKK